MKKILLASVALLLSALCYAQRSVDFKLQWDGSMLTEEGMNFTVIACDGKSQQELFKEIESAVGRVYVKPSEVISKVDGEQISVTGITANQVKYGLIAVQPHYTIVFRFKDGKIRVDAPVINHLMSGLQVISPFSGWLDAQRIFNRKTHEPYKLKVIDGLNDVMNSTVNTILKSSQETQDDW